MLLIVTLMSLAAVAGFLAGRECDRYAKKVNYNRRLRREKVEQLRMDAELDRAERLERKKFDFMYNVQYDAPGQ